ncbi:hypothetical protein [Paenibacillus sp. Soil724D2]|uniref:hypothetical protein n=1 Tax=Paenibacillus sp. (strain Soil724D2) TaxID=1736392 RepID=UPI0007123DF2|nr:hypothetical protein [Paenibacillus sp. Soil724D2]KRE33259.1 hypothetical protein ASG85_13340 [Paenibacillus sp. Soil724D2]
MNDNKTNFTSIEKELGKQLGRIYRGVTGRGPIHAEARIVNQAIFIQYKVERLAMEKKYISFLQSRNEENEFFEFIRPDFKIVVGTLMRELNYSLSVEGIEFRVDPDITYVLVTLNKNLEKMLLSGEAKLSHVE